MFSFYSDVMKFWSVVLDNEKPDWCSKNSILLKKEAFLLRDFNIDREMHSTPILILPPQAGHHSCIADYDLQGQSLVKTCLDFTKSPVYAVEWKSATHRNKNDLIENLVQYVDDCVNKLNGKVHLIGLCQGGWLSAIYTALFPEKVKSLTLGAAPIDFTAGGGKLQEMVQQIPMSNYEAIVAAGGGMMRGDHMLMGWKMMNSYDRFCGDYIDLWNNIQNEKYLCRSKKFRSWYEYTQDIAGAWYLQVVSDLFKQNKLISKELMVFDQYVDLSAIQCPIALLAGDRDDITLIPQLFNFADYVSTPTDQVMKTVLPDCGHIGVFIRKKSQEFWVQALDFVTCASQERPTTSEERMAA